MTTQRLWNGEINCDVLFTPTKRRPTQDGDWVWSAFHKEWMLRAELIELWHLGYEIGYKMGIQQMVNNMITDTTVEHYDP